MLKNDYLLAKIGFDTAENEPSKVWTCLPAPLPPLNQLRMSNAKGMCCKYCKDIAKFAAMHAYMSATVN